MSKEQIQITVPGSNNTAASIFINGTDMSSKITSVVIKVAPKGCDILVGMQADPKDDNSPSSMLGARFEGEINITTDEFPFREQSSTASIPG